MSAIALEHVSKQWGDNFAVDDASFAAPAGAFVVLLGPSGCGKSTTLRMIAGLDTPSAGRIRIDQRDVTCLPPRQRRLSMVFQSYALFPHLDVRENILFGVKVRNEPAKDHARRLARVADLLGLTALLDRKPSQLSGGQQQRVALGRAIIAETPVCLMDEPLSNLDAQLRQEMRREIRALQRKLGITMVYVTHDQTEAMSMADQVILLRRGRIEQDAPPATLYAKPASVFAARFIGTPPMNIIDCPGRPDLKLGVRPEHIRIVDADADAKADADANAGINADGGRLHGIVQSAEYFGADTIITCSIESAACAEGASSASMDATLAARVPGQHRLAAGARIGLAWQRDAEHRFDAASGLRRDDL